MRHKNNHNMIGSFLVIVCLWAMLPTGGRAQAADASVISAGRIMWVPDAPVALAEPDMTDMPDVTGSPDVDASGINYEPADENMFPVSPAPSETDMPQLAQPRRLRIVDYTASTVSLQWQKVKNADKYVVYRRKSGAADYKKIAVTRKCKYKNTKLRGKTVYRYRIMAVGENAAGEQITSAFSSAKKVRTKPVVRKTAYVGDSVMYGARALYRHKGQKVIAKIGVSTWNFWNGDLMDRLLRYNPDRIYIMLGVNSLVGKPSSQHCNVILADYKKIIRQCKKKNPDVDIVMLSVAPSTAHCRSVRNSYINMYNKKQKKVAKQMRVQYYDFTKSFKDSSGHLKRRYNGGDGLHWNSPGCICFAKQLKKYERKMA